MRALDSSLYVPPWHRVVSERERQLSDEAITARTYPFSTTMNGDFAQSRARL